MRKILYSCTTGEHVYGLDRVSMTPIFKKHVFIQDNEDFLGFRRRQTFIVNGFEIYYEIGFFFELLYEGDRDAFEMLHCPEDFVDYKTEEWDIIVEQKEMFDSMAFINTIYDSTNELYKAIKSYKSIIKEDGEGEEENKIFYKKLGYDKEIAYLCMRNLYLLHNSLIHNKIDFDVPEKNILRAVDLGKFKKLTTIRKEINKLFKKVDKYSEQNELNPSPDFEEVDKLLLRLRTEKIYHATTD